MNKKNRMNSNYKSSSFSGNNTNDGSFVVMIPFSKTEGDYNNDMGRLTLKQYERVRMWCIAKSRENVCKELTEAVAKLNTAEDIEIDKMFAQRVWDCDGVFMSREDYEKLVKNSSKKELLWNLAKQ